MTGWGVMRSTKGSLHRSWGKAKEYFRVPSPIYDHANTTGNHTSVDTFSILGRGSQCLVRTIMQALYIRVNNTLLNRNIGKYQLSQILDEVLFDTQNPLLK